MELSTTKKERTEKLRPSNKTASFSMDDGPTSTTKALLVSIVAPRKISTRTKKEEEVKEDKTVDTEMVEEVEPKSETTCEESSTSGRDGQTETPPSETTDESNGPKG